MKSQKIQCRVRLKMRNDIEIYVRKRSLFQPKYNISRFLLEAIEEKLYDLEDYYRHLIKTQRECVAKLEILRDEISDTEKEMAKKETKRMLAVYRTPETQNGGK